MADNMKRLPIAPLLLLTLLLPLLSVGARAQAVQDPTRPPPELIKRSAGAPAAGAPQLQSILVARGAGGRRVAVIDGAMVRIGDMVRGARVTGMTASAVQLQRGGKRETLKMMAPEAEPDAPPVAVAPPAGKPE